MPDIHDCIRSLVPGRIRLRHPMLHGLDLATKADVEAMLMGFDGVTGATINPRVASLLITWDTSVMDVDTMLGVLEMAAAMVFPMEGVEAESCEAPADGCACATEAADEAKTSECAEASDASCASTKYVDVCLHKADALANAVNDASVKVFGSAAKVVMPTLSATRPARAARTVQNRAMLIALGTSVATLLCPQLRFHVWASGAFLGFVGLHLLQHRRVL